MDGGLAHKLACGMEADVTDLRPLGHPVMISPLRFWIFDTIIAYRAELTARGLTQEHSQLIHPIRRPAFHDIVALAVSFRPSQRSFLRRKVRGPARPPAQPITGIDTPVSRARITGTSALALLGGASRSPRRVSRFGRRRMWNEWSGGHSHERLPVCHSWVQGLPVFVAGRAS